MFARFDENPAMTLQDIKETKRYGRTDACTDGRTDGQRENSIPHHKQSLRGGVKIVLVLTAVILSKIIFSEPNSFMHMFNVLTLYRQSIKLFHQKLW